MLPPPPCLSGQHTTAAVITAARLRHSHLHVHARRRQLARARGGAPTPTATCSQQSTTTQSSLLLQPLPYSHTTSARIPTRNATSYTAPPALRHRHPPTPCPLQRSHLRSLAYHPLVASSRLPLTQPPPTAIALIAPRAPLRAALRPVRPVGPCRRRRIHLHPKHTRGPPQITSKTSRGWTSNSPTLPDPSARGEASRETLQWLTSQPLQTSPRGALQVTPEDIQDTTQNSRNLLLLLQMALHPQKPGRPIPRT